MGNTVSESGEKAYKIKLDDANKLGEGSFASVYKIKRQRDNLLCAAKIFKISVSNMSSKEEMGYERELKILKEADHPFIIDYIEEFLLKKNQLCIVTKLASGGDLEKYMRNKHFLEEEAMEFFAMILLGLDFLHSKNIFHRDLKPGNILIDQLQDGMKILKIGDFGISKMNLQTMKQTQTTFGFDTTPAYKSPEVLEMNEATPKVDIWALGIILYQLLTSKHPFMRDDPWQTIIAIKEAKLSPLPDSIKEENKKIVSLLLKKDQNERPDAKTLLSKKEIQKVVESLIKRIQKCDPKISKRILQKNQLSFFEEQQTKDYIQLFQSLRKKHSQLEQLQIQKLLDDLGFNNIEEAVDEKIKLEQRLDKISMTNDKVRSNIQQNIESIDYILRFIQDPNSQGQPQLFIQTLNKSAEIQSDQENQLRKNQHISIKNSVQSLSIVLENESLLQKEIELAQIQVEFIKNLPDCFEKSVKMLTYILFKKLGNKILSHDTFLNIPTSMLNDLIKVHLKNIKETFIEEVDNKEIIDKVNSISHSVDENLEQFKSILSFLIEIQPLLSRFNFQEFFQYIEDSNEAVQRLENCQSKIIVLLLGAAGSGKSSTIHYICGSEIQENSGSGLKHLECRDLLNQDLINVKVRSNQRIQTRNIKAINIDKKLLGASNSEEITLIYTPGLFEIHNAEIEASNQIGIYKALQQVQSIRPIIVFTYQELGENGKTFKENLISYVQMIVDSYYIDFFNFFFTLVEKDLTVENLAEKIKNILEGLNQIEKSNKGLVKFLEVIVSRAENKKVHIIDPLNDKKALNIIEGIIKTQEIPRPSFLFQKVISDQSKTKIIEQFDLQASAIINAFNKANGNRVDLLLTQLTKFSQIMDASENYKERINQILKAMSQKLNQNFDEIINIFKDFIHPGSQISEEASKIFKNKIQLSNDLENVRQQFLCETGEVHTPSSQDIEKELQKLALLQFNLLQPEKIDAQNLHDFLQKLDILANSNISILVSIKNEIFNKVNVFLQYFQKKTIQLLTQINSQVENGLQDFDTEQILTKDFENEYSSDQNFDQLSNLLKQLDKASKINKIPNLKNEIKNQIDSIVKILKKKLSDLDGQKEYEQFEQTKIQNMRNTSEINIEELITSPFILLNKIRVQHIKIYIKNKRFSEAHDLIQDYCKSFQIQDSQNLGLNLLDQIQESQQLSQDLDDAINSTVQEFLKLRDNPLLEKLIQKSPKKIILNLQKSQSLQLQKYARIIIEVVKASFEENLNNLINKQSQKSLNGLDIPYQINQFIKMCAQLPQNLNDQFKDQIKDIEKKYLEEQKAESDKIKNFIMNKNDDKFYFQELFFIIDQAVYSLDQQCKNLFNEFYKQLIKESINALIENGLENFEVILHKVWLFQSTESTKTQLDLLSKKYFSDLELIIQKIQQQIIKRIIDLIQDRETQNWFPIKIFDQEKIFTIENIAWYQKILQDREYMDCAIQLVPNFREEVLMVIDLQLNEIRKYSDEFNRSIKNEDLINELGIFKIIIQMRNFKQAQGLLTKNELINFLKHPEASPESLEKISEFQKLSQDANYGNFSLKLAENYQIQIQKFNLAKFFIPNDPSIKINSEIIKNFEKVNKYLDFVKESKQITIYLKEVGIDPEQIQKDLEEQISNFYNKIVQQIIGLVQDLMKSLQLQQIQILFDNLLIIQEIFKQTVPCQFSQLQLDIIKKLKFQSQKIINKISNAEDKQNKEQTQNLSWYISDSLKQFTNIAQNLAFLKSLADECIQNICDCLDKMKDQSIITEIYMILKKSSHEQIITLQKCYIKGQREFLACKTQNQDMQYLLENIFKNNQEELTSNEKDILKNQYIKFQKMYSDLVQTNIGSQLEIIDNINTIRLKLLELTNKIKNEGIDFSSHNKICEIMAYLFSLWTLQDFYKNKFNCDEVKKLGNINQVLYLLRPHPAQVISILRIFGIGNDQIIKQNQDKLIQTKKDQLKNFIQKDIMFDNIVQMKPGEGQLIVLAIVAAIFALWDFEVSCVFQSYYKSNDNYNQFKELFEFLDIHKNIFYCTFDQVCEKQINYEGDIRNIIVNRILKEQNINIQPQHKSQKKVMLFDEIDIIFNQQYFNKIHVAVAQIKNKKVSNLLDYVWSLRNQKGDSLIKIKQTQQYNECAALFKPECIGIFEETFKDMLYAAQNFVNSINDCVVFEGKIQYIDQNEVSQRKIYGYNTIFANYYHYDIPSQDGSLVSYQSLEECKALLINCGQFSYAEIPLQSMIILGLSSYLQYMNNFEKETIQDIFQIRNFTFMPSIYGQSKLRWQSQDPFERTIILSKNEHFNQLYCEIREKLNRNGCFRAVLVFFENQDDLNKFKCSQQYQQINCKKQEITQFDSSSSKQEKIYQATFQNTLTLITKSLVNGTEFICNDEIVEVNGGVHVILTFVPEKNSEFVQFQGKTAIQGNYGSFQMILLDQDLAQFGVYVDSEAFKQEYKDKLNYIFQQRDKVMQEKEKSIYNEINIIRAMHIETLKIKDILVNNESSKYQDLYKYVIKINHGPSDENDGFGMKMPADFLKFYKQ